MDTRDLNTLFRAFYEHSMDGVLLSEPSGIIYAANPAACNMLRSSEEELRRMGRSGLVDDASPKTQEFLSKRAREGVAVEELEFTRGDGSRFIAEVRSNIYTDHKKKKRTIIILRDISKEKLLAKKKEDVEEDLVEERIEFESIVNNTEDFVWSVDADSFALRSFNNSLRDYLKKYAGITIHKGMRPQELTSDPEHIKSWRDMYQKALKQGAYSTEYETPSGSHVLQLNLSRLKNDQVFGVSVIGIDITERKHAENVLKNSEYRYRSLVCAMNEGVLYMSADGSIYDANPAAEEILGRSTDEIFSMRSTDSGWGAIHEDGTDFPGSEHPAMYTLSTGKPMRGVIMGITHPDMNRRWISINSEPIFANPHDKKPAASVITLHDITEKKYADEKLAAYVRQLENMMDQSLHAVANMVEMRDPYTSGHEHRVGLIAADIAGELGWSDEDCKALRLIGLVHDIGKIAVPSDILTKPGKLSELEFQMVKEHAEKGYEVLKNIEFPLPIADIVHQHHERMDGSGYPQQLKGDEILPEARIIAVADVLESMSSHRPYRPALGIEVALDELKKHRGKLYDPKAVDALLMLVNEKGYQLPE